MERTERLQAIFAEFNAATGCALKLDDTLSCAFTYRELPLSLHYLPESDMLLLWSILPDLGADENATPRAEWLLARMDGFVNSRGFTYALTGETDSVMILDRRSLDEIDTADGLAAWIAALLDDATDICQTSEFEFPFVDDDPLPEDEPEEGEVK